jgi:hypothetical protein
MLILLHQPWDTGEDDQVPENKFEYEEVATDRSMSIRAQQVCPYHLF